MTYQEAKSKLFAKYCKEGRMHLVKKWGDNPNVDVNWNKHSPLRQAVKSGQIEPILYLLNHSKLRTDYENDTRPLSGSLSIKPGAVTGELNPFTEAVMRKNFEILDIFVKSNRFKINRIEHLDILIQMNDDVMNDYFKNINGFTDFVLESGEKYISIISSEASDIFLF